MPTTRVVQGSINIPIIYLPPLLRGKVGALYFRMSTVTYPESNKGDIRNGYSGAEHTHWLSISPVRK